MTSASRMTVADLHLSFIDPPREFGILPFWFWNDDLQDDELIRQIHEFHAKGFGGFLLHPRVGLSRRIGYLTDEFFRLVRLAVDEAARLGMKVVLYDEGSYPSGSAAGQVVAANPAHASRAIITRQQEVSGPAAGFWHPNPGRALTDELVAVVAGREMEPGMIDPTTVIELPIQEPELARYDLPAGQWRLTAIWHVHSGGAIRGVFPEQEDGHALAPAAGDILNPAAVASFLHLTHDQYFVHLADHFGSTVVAMFTDEPMVLGRGAKRGPKAWPFTPGFLAEVQAGWDEDITKWLPALWLDYGARTAEFRQHYTDAVNRRLERVFYGAQGEWCAAHGIALTGHPAESNDFGALRKFQWPGQDMVWRWVTPGAASALEGPHSCAPKCAASAAALQGSRRNGSEALGAYGWQLTLDGPNGCSTGTWYCGNNLFFLHAVFYSVRGRRAYESEPDLGIHNVWWPHFQLIGDYLRRLCWLLSDGQEICAVAILTHGNDAAWQAAKVLYQQQIDFLYIDDVALASASVDQGQLLIGQQRFQSVICDPTSADRLVAAEHPVLQQFIGEGGQWLADWQPEILVATLTAHVQRDVVWRGTAGSGMDLRVLHYRKAGRDFYLLVNEGETLLTGDLVLAGVGLLERWDPLTGSTQPWPSQQYNGCTHTSIRLERRQSSVLMVDPAGAPDAAAAASPDPGAILQEVQGPWRVADAEGNPLSLPCPGNWAQMAGWETFAGTLTYQTEFSLAPLDTAAPLFLDLGTVDDIADLWINDQRVGCCGWSPYCFRIDTFCHSGVNTLTVHVTNSIANHYEGLQLPSGLLGPVVLRRGGTVGQETVGQ
ncbi:MAG: hypothetical protein R2867_25685 [Caldilineaceae bacterium]